MTPGQLGRLKSTIYGTRVVRVANTLGRIGTISCNGFANATFGVDVGIIVMFASGPYHGHWSRSADNDIVCVFVPGLGLGYVHDCEFVPL